MTTDSFLREIETTKQKLDNVSQSFCLAKWLQVTIHLHSGYNHSCHHPRVHQIPLKEIKSNPSALHNTSFKKEQRRQMLKGKRPLECNYCWNIEDLKGNQISDRYVKSNDDWAQPHFDKVSQLPWNEDILPTYVEVAFSRTCNFKCTYCAPSFSSSWLSEMQEKGAFPISNPYHLPDRELEANSKKLMTLDENPYIEAFWKWWPELYPALKVFRVTGGEPLLSKDTFRMLDEIRSHPHPNTNLELAVNSNLGVPTQLIEKLCLGVKQLLEEKRIKFFRFYVSLDTWGSQAEYIRSGLDLELFEKNLNRIMELLPDSQITFMCTFNALSVFSFKQFLQKIIEWRSRHRVILDISYLRAPEMMSIKVLPSQFEESLGDILAFMEKHKFFDYEVNKFRRVVEYFKTKNEFDVVRHRKDFVHFFREIDKRRGQNLLETFPELTSTLEAWNEL